MPCDTQGWKPMANYLLHQACLEDMHNLLRESLIPKVQAIGTYATIASCPFN